MIDWIGLGILGSILALVLGGFAIRDPKWQERRDNAYVVFGIIVVLTMVIAVAWFPGYSNW